MRRLWRGCSWLPRLLRPGRCWRPLVVSWGLCFQLGCICHLAGRFTAVAAVAALWSVLGLLFVLFGRLGAVLGAVAGGSGAFASDAGSQWAPGPFSLDLVVPDEFAGAPESWSASSGCLDGNV